MKKKNIKYIILAVIAIVAVFFVFLYNKPVEKPVARVDITTALVNAKKPQFEIYVDNSEEKEEQSDWMDKYKIQGYVVQNDSGVKDIKIKAVKDADINILLRGRWEKDANGNFVEHWVKYTSMVIDNQEVLPQAVNVWHNEPYRYTIKAKAGDEHQVHIEWTKSDK